MESASFGMPTEIYSRDISKMRKLKGMESITMQMAPNTKETGKTICNTDLDEKNLKINLFMKANMSLGKCLEKEK